MCILMLAQLCVAAKEHQHAREAHNLFLAQIREEKAAINPALNMQHADETGGSAPPAVGEDAVLAAYGLEQVNKIVTLLRGEFGEILDTMGFMDDLWVAIQVRYGPTGAADFILYCKDSVRMG